jgi:3-oxoacyl-[acyl-carrier protein] reductase
MKPDEWSSVINTNLNGNFFVTQVVAVNMIKQKSGSIVNITSISGVCGNIGQANYSASKGGIIALTKTLSLELARYNIRVNAIAPGVINSSMSAHIPNLPKILSHIHMGRFGEPKEVAVATYFMAVDATYTTGQVLNLCGGACRG